MYEKYQDWFKAFMRIAAAGIIGGLAIYLLCSWLLPADGGGDGGAGPFIEQAQQQSAVIEEGIAKSEERVARIEEGARVVENLSSDSAELIERCQQILRNSKERGKTEE